MELTFREQTVSYLSETVYDPSLQELTAELIVPESLPEVGRIVDCCGTVLVQSRSADSGGLSVCGGVHANLLYVPASGEGVETIDAYLPFTVTKAAQTEPDSVLFYWGWLKSVDGRCINSRKLLLRANLGSELTLLSPQTLHIAQLAEQPRSMECLTNTYRYLLPLCAAERDIRLTDEVPLPEQLPAMERILKWSVVCEVTESRLLGSKAVFKGNLLLRCLYLTPEGVPTVFQTALPYSQYAELDREAEQGMLSIQPILRHAEIDTDGQAESRRLLVDITATAQILMRGDAELTLTQDAYVPGGRLDAEWQSFNPAPLLDVQTVKKTATLTLPPEAETVLDWSVCTDAPTVQTQEGGCKFSAPVSVNLLYYDREHTLQGKQLRAELTGSAAGAGRPQLSAIPGMETAVQGSQLLIPAAAELRYVQREPVKTLCGGTVTLLAQKDRPSLIVTRCGGPVWEIAKQKGSTVRAIEAANSLSSDTVEPGTLLLIPLGQSAQA